MGRINPAVLALAVGSFGIGLTEFAIVGVLPQVAESFGVGEAIAGWLVSGYAVSVAVGGILLTVAATRITQKSALLVLMGLFIVGNALSSLATTYSTMLAGRIIAALCHGAFFGVGAVLAADLAGKGRRAGAIALMFGGLTLANVLGVPLGTWIAQTWGWRMLFWVIVANGILGFVSILLLVPRANTHEQITVTAEFRTLTRPSVLVSLGITVFGFGGMFGAFTYIAYTLTRTSGFSEAAVPWLLMLFGVGLVLGNLMGGRLADRHGDGALIALLVLLSLNLAAFAAFARSPVAAAVLLFAMGCFGFATVPALQSRVLRHAHQAPTLASGANIAAFNIGNALGAWLGGLTVSAGLGYASTFWVATAMTLVALVILVSASAIDRRRVSWK